MAHERSRVPIGLREFYEVLFIIIPSSISLIVSHGGSVSKCVMANLAEPYVTHLLEEAIVDSALQI